MVNTGTVKGKYVYLTMIKDRDADRAALAVASSTGLGM